MKVKVISLSRPLEASTKYFNADVESMVLLGMERQPV